MAQAQLLLPGVPSQHRCPEGHRKCRKCSAFHPETEEFFFRHKGCRKGLLPKCKSCVTAENEESYKKRLAREPDVVKENNAIKAMRHYNKNIDDSRRKMREVAAKARKDPEKRARINMRKRGGGAGLTPEEFEAMFEAQGRRCAICRTDKHGTKLGWNIDHCHKANEVRFILCPHCNRGLGAFKDSPALMRRAADVLERWQEGKER